MDLWLQFSKTQFRFSILHIYCLWAQVTCGKTGLLATPDVLGSTSGLNVILRALNSCQRRLGVKVTCSNRNLPYLIPQLDDRSRIQLAAGGEKLGHKHCSLRHQQHRNVWGSYSGSTLNIKTAGKKRCILIQFENKINQNKRKNYCTKLRVYISL